MDGWNKRAISKVQSHDKSADVDFWTPSALFEAVNKKFGPFTLDAAASRENTKCTSYFTEEQDGLNQKWTGVVWCNPPYGRETKASRGTAAWFRKAVAEIDKGHAERIVILAPSYTDLAYFHEVIFPRVNTIIYIKSRVKFDGPNICKGGTARHASALYVFEKSKSRGIKIGSIYRDGTSLVLR